MKSQLASARSINSVQASFVFRIKLPVGKRRKQQNSCSWPYLEIAATVNCCRGHFGNVLKRFQSLLRILDYRYLASALSYQMKLGLVRNWSEYRTATPATMRSARFFALFTDLGYYLCGVTGHNGGYYGTSDHPSLSSSIKRAKRYQTHLLRPSLVNEWVCAEIFAGHLWSRFSQWCGKVFCTSSYNEMRFFNMILVVRFLCRFGFRFP